MQTSSNVIILNKLCDITQPSDHSARKDFRERDDLEPKLRDWGVYRRIDISELSTPHKTSLKVAEELRPEQIKNPLPRIYDAQGKLKPAWFRRMCQEIGDMWKRNHKSTRYVTGQAPEYNYHRRMSKLDGIIARLTPKQFSVVVMRYEFGWTWEDCHREIGMPKNVYHKQLRAAKKNINNMLIDGT